MLTKSFADTVRKRAERDPEFREALIAECIENAQHNVGMDRIRRTGVHEFKPSGITAGNTGVELCAVCGASKALHVHQTL